MRQLLLVLAIVVPMLLLGARAEARTQQQSPDLEARVTALAQRVAELEREVCSLRGGVYVGYESAPCSNPAR